MSKALAALAAYSTSSISLRRLPAKVVQSPEVTAAIDTFHRLSSEPLRKVTDPAPLWTSDTALISAIKQNDVPLVRGLLNFGANPNSTRCPSNTTPLHFAARDGRREIAVLLLQKGADVNARIEPSLLYGQTPLMLAARQKHPDVVRMLVSARSDLKIKDSWGQPALDYAISSLLKP